MHAELQLAGSEQQLSLEERDRRWTLVRARMEKEGVDILLTAPNTGLWDQLQAHARWLTGVGGNCAGVGVVFPSTGDVTAITSPVPGPGFWRGWQNWVNDVRSTPWAIGAGIVARLRELAADGRCIAIAGLSGSPRLPEGLVQSGLVDMIRTTFPEAQIRDATEWMNELRDVKSLEEIDAIRRAVAICEEGMSVMRAEARPGVPERIVYGRMVGKMIELGSQPPNMLMWAAGNLAEHMLVTFPTARPLAEGDTVFVEVEARVRGYLGQVTKMAVVGDVAPALDDMFRVVRQTVERVQQTLRPGAQLGAIAEECRRSAAAEPYDVFPILHARALGEDSPILIFNTTDKRVLEWPVKVNQTYAIKVQVRAKSGGAMAFWGESMWITEKGAQRFGKWPIEVLKLGTSRAP